MILDLAGWLACLAGGFFAGEAYIHGAKPLNVIAATLLAIGTIGPLFFW